MQLPSSQEELTRGFSPVEPNQYMGAGRTLEPYFVEGKTTVRTIGASWTGDDNHPIADTAVPVRVYDQRYEQPHVTAWGGGTEQMEPMTK